jgi:hypothetical protein
MAGYLVIFSFTEVISKTAILEVSYLKTVRARSGGLPKIPFSSQVPFMAAQGSPTILDEWSLGSWHWHQVRFARRHATPGSPYSPP